MRLSTQRMAGPGEEEEAEEEEEEDGGEAVRILSDPAVDSFRAGPSF